MKPAVAIVLEAVWTVEGNRESAELGTCVSSAGDVNGDGYADVVIGVPYSNHSVLEYSSAQVFHGSRYGLAATPDWTMTFFTANSGFGSAVASAGDVNADGYSDVAVGALDAVHVYEGSANGVEYNARTIYSDESGEGLAADPESVAGAGDVDGDGYSDLIVGAPNYGNALVGRGRAYLYPGSDNSIVVLDAWSAEGEYSLSHFGRSVSSAGDVNDDGYSDVVIGAPGYGTRFEGGAAFIYQGSALGLEATAARRVHPEEPGKVEFGGSVSSAGDVNGDGFDDIIIGAPNHGSLNGRAYLYLGSTSGLVTDPVWLARGDQSGRLGASVSTAGDVNGDGFGDVVVGEPSFGEPEGYEGRVRLFLGSSSGLATNAAWSAESNESGSYFGSVVSDAGDVNGDGGDDIVVGAPTYSNGLEDMGRAYAYHGNCTGGGIGVVCDPCPFEPDDDGDGACDDIDCDPTRETVYPGAPEICDSLDNACAGSIPPEDADLDWDGWAICEGDCDDADREVFPQAPEHCNGVDDDCDGAIPSGELDADGDSLAACAGDCDDADAARSADCSEPPDATGCGCASSSSRTAPWIPLIMGLMALRRRLTSASYP